MCTLCSKTIIVIDHGYCYRLRLADNEQFVTEFVSDVVEMYRKTDKLAAIPWYLDKLGSIGLETVRVVLSAIYQIVSTGYWQDRRKKFYLDRNHPFLKQQGVSCRNFLQYFACSWRCLKRPFQIALIYTQSSVPYEL